MLRRDTHQAMLELYRTVDDRWRHDMSDVSLRLDRVATHNLIQDERTEAMASVLLAGDGPRP